MACIYKLRSTDLQASNIPVNLFKGVAVDLYALSIPYAVDAMVYDNTQDVHRVYKSRISSNTLTSVSDLLNTENWLDKGPTDRYACADQKRSNQSFYAEQVQVDIDASLTDTVGLFGLEATEIDLELFYDSVSVRAETFSMIRPGEQSLYAYQCHMLQYKKLLLWQYPFFGSSTVLRATIKWPSGVAKCGVIAAGVKYEIGGTLKNPSQGISIDSKSRIVEDEYGDVEFVPRKRKKKHDVSLWFPTSELPSIYNTMEDLDATPAIFNMNNTGDNEALITYGYYTPWKVDIPGNEYSRATMTIKEIV